MSVLAAINPRPILAGPSVPGIVEAGPFVTRNVPFSHLFRHDFEIEALNRQAMAPNVFYHPGVLASLAHQYPPRAQIRLVMVHGRDGVLRAMAPIVAPSAAAGGPLRLGRAFSGPLHPDATPLIDGATPAAADALVAGLMQAGGAVFDHLDVDGPVAALLRQAADERNLKTLCYDAGDQSSFRLEGADMSKRGQRAIKSARRALVRSWGRLRYSALSDPGEIEAALVAANEMDRLAGPVNGMEPRFDDPAANGVIGRLLRGQEDAPVLTAHRLQGGRIDLAIAITLNIGRAFWLWRLAIKPGAARKLAGLVLADMAWRKAAKPETAKNAPGWTLEGTGFGSGARLFPFGGQKRRIGQLIVASSFRADAERAMGRLAHAARNLAAPQQQK